MLRHFNNLSKKIDLNTKKIQSIHLPLDVHIYRILLNWHLYIVKHVEQIRSQHTVDQDKYPEMVSIVFVPIQLLLFYLQYHVIQIHRGQEHH